MRTVTFSDDRVTDLLNRKFVCAWKNIRPREGFPDGLYRRLSREELARTQPGGGSNNICAYVATADGAIRHAIQGYWGVEEFLAELEFGLKAAGTPADKREELYKARLKELERDRGSKKSVALRLLEKNLDALFGAAADLSLEKLDDLTGLGKARDK